MSDSSFYNAKPFESFIRHSDQKSNEIRVVEHVAKAFWQDFSADRPLRIVDIGCGYGYPAHNFANAFGAYGPVHYTGIDPSPTMLNQFVGGGGKPLANVELAGAEAAFFDSFSYPKSDWQFEHFADIVIVSHVLYFAKNIKQALKDVLSITQRHGLVLFFHQNSQSDMAKIRSLCVAENQQGWIAPADEIAAELGQPWPSINLTSRINMKNFGLTPHLAVSDKNLNPELYQLLSFITRSDWARLSPDIQQRVWQETVKLQAGQGQINIQEIFQIAGGSLAASARARRVMDYVSSQLSPVSQKISFYA